MTTFKIVGIIAICAVAAFVGYGAYGYYFNRKPATVVNNEYKTYTMGENSTVNEAPKKVDKQRRFFTGLYGNRSEIGVTAGWLW